jgi:hypothetical protein
MYKTSWKVDEADGYEIYKIDKCFERLENASDCNSLLKKHLTPKLKEKLKHKKTKLGGTLIHIINSGLIINPIEKHCHLAILTY